MKELAMSVRPSLVAAIALLVPCAATAPAAEPTRRESASVAAAAQGRLDDLRPLLDGEKPSPAALANALVAAARAGHAGSVRLVLVRGAEVGRPGADYGMTALDAAVRNGHREVAEQLVRSG